MLLERVRWDYPDKDVCISKMNNLVHRGASTKYFERFEVQPNMNFDYA